jgi:heme-degrading monooxygenase HmoA
MFGRIVEFTPKPEVKDEIVNVLRNEVVPILRKQHGFVEFLPFVPEAKTGKWITVTLWAEKRDEERWDREDYPKVDGILRFYLVAPPIVNHFNVETSLCQRQHSKEALTA